PGWGSRPRPPRPAPPTWLRNRPAPFPTVSESPMAKHCLMVGAGLSGAVIGHMLAEAGHQVTVADARPHVAGNCHTTRDAATGVMVHVYGPHIFHTDDAEVWDYVNGFETFLPYKNRVKTTSQGAVYSLP